MDAMNNGGDDRRTTKRRDNDQWVAEMIQEIVDANNKALEAQRLRGQRALRSLAVGYLILMLGLAFGLWQLEQRDTHRSNTAIALASKNLQGADTGRLKECQRVNRLRIQANGGNEIIFATLWVSAQREAALARSGINKATHARSAQALRFLALRSRHTPLTDCQAATFDAANYKPPRSVPFNPKTDVLVKLLRELQ